MAIVELSHDPFARQSVVRECVSIGGECFNCGLRRKPLYRYGIQRDDRPGTIDWERYKYCNKGCHDNANP